VFTPVLAKHTKNFELIDNFPVGVDRIELNFEPMRRQVEVWPQTKVIARGSLLVIYCFNPRALGIRNRRQVANPPTLDNLSSAFYAS